jgi:hypothetical protein
MPQGVTFTEVKRTFAATMNLMWKASTANSIPVPIGFRQWSATEDALRAQNGTWSVGGASTWSAGTYTAASANQNFNGYPTWNTQVVNGPCTSYNLGTTD